ncbi:MAG: hypothetical protein HC781_08970 [Leptolyngbyaceae cyanobacterium CSU_1_4]|nr:hypothetical protein [Leptolyngbyaceae cyanobacterium CSU_1_4]
MHPDPPSRLELLVPWELPIEQPLNAADQVRVGRALQQLLQALQQESHEAALQQVIQTLADLGTIPTHLAEVSSTKTPLKQPEVEEFDDYFETIRVQSPDLPGCLVQSLLITYWRSLHLWLQATNLDPLQIYHQKQGFISYVHLLARVFHLNLEASYDTDY